MSASPNLNFATEYWIDVGKRLDFDPRSCCASGGSISSAQRPETHRRARSQVPDPPRRPDPAQAGELCAGAHDPLGDKPINQARPPFIVVDPRAGHGPGIGGMKQDSEISIAMAAGHPCSFVEFFPAAHAQTDHRRRVRSRSGLRRRGRRRAIPSPRASPSSSPTARPGWQVMMMAAIRPDLVGPILLAGSPLSYWAGVHGRNPIAISAARWAGPG